MSYEYIRRALEVRLSALSPSVPTSWENIPFTPPNSIYQRAYILPASTDNPTYGGSFMRESGILHVSVCAPIGNGALDAVSRAGLLRSWFYRGLSLDSNGVIVRILRSPSIAPAIYEEKTYVIPVSIPYFADI